jgi:hypothetical protein
MVGSVDRLNGANTMRSMLALGLLISLCASANAATVLRSKRPAAHLRPVQRVTVPEGYAVPGWTDEETRKWLYNGSAAAGLG